MKGHRLSAYIFQRAGTDWTEQAKLYASDAAAGDEFGCFVSIDGDYAIVGAYWNDDAGASSGSAYVCEYNVPPTANDDGPGAGFTTDEDATFTTANVLTNDSDPDAGDTLSVQGIDTTGTQGLVTDNGDGTFTYDPNGQFEYLAAGKSATDTFIYTIEDESGATATATVTIGITGAYDNAKPVAYNSNPDTKEACVSKITLKGDDGDPGEDQALTYFIDSLPDNGKLYTTKADAQAGTNALPAGA